MIFFWKIDGRYQTFPLNGLKMSIQVLGALLLTWSLLILIDFTLVMVPLHQNTIVLKSIPIQVSTVAPASSQIINVIKPLKRWQLPKKKLIPVRARIKSNCWRTNISRTAPGLPRRWRSSPKSSSSPSFKYISGNGIKRDPLKTTYSPHNPTHVAPNFHPSRCLSSPLLQWKGSSNFLKSLECCLLHRLHVHTPIMGS